MNLLVRIFKFLQSEAHSFVSRFEDPVKLIEQGIRDLKKDFDESMKNVAQIKAIAIGTKKELEAKKQIADDYEHKAMILLQKAKNNELEESEADRLAAEALKKRKEALAQVEKLSQDAKKYDESLEQMSKKVMQLKDKIKEAENEYTSLKARATVAKTTKKVNQQLSSVNLDSTSAMIEEMKTKIQAEENLAEAYEQTLPIETSVDDEINKAIGTDIDIQKSLEAMKQKLLANPEDNNDIDKLKKDLED
ncbi:PspA/IM30 family protein [bacterium]|nr:PspA/IM30 family protein [bacterium]